MNIKRIWVRSTVVAAVGSICLLFTAASAQATIITAAATWSGNVFGNPTLITGTFTFNTDNYMFDAGGPAGHEFWYAMSTITTSGVTVANSPISSDNGLYSGSAYDVLLLDSSNPDPAAALTSPGLAMMLLPNGSDPAAPHNYGYGGMQTAGSEPTLFNGVVVNPVPEPATLSMVIAGSLASLAVARRLYAVSCPA